MERSWGERRAKEREKERKEKKRRKTKKMNVFLNLKMCYFIIAVSCVDEGKYIYIYIYIYIYVCVRVCVRVCVGVCLFMIVKRAWVFFFCMSAYMYSWLRAFIHPLSLYTYT